MIRRKAGPLLISSIIVLSLLLLGGVAFLFLPSIMAATTNRSTVSSGQASNAAHTMKSTAHTNHATSQAAVQSKKAASTTTKSGTNPPAANNGNNTQPAPAPSANNGNNVQPTPVTTSQNLTVPIVTLKQYVSDIRHMVAQSFNITDKELALQLQQGMHLKNIAMQHGVSNAQLQNLLSTSISTGFQPAISAGSLTQMQVSSFIQQTQQNPTTLEQQLSILPPVVAHW